VTEQLILLSSNPLAPLYGLQALTYTVAAVLSQHAGHKDLCACYSFSALIHAAFAACHMLHLA
jgi:hypothetical protein